jgi:DNA-binding transcriptional LysR family regulator
MARLRLGADELADYALVADRITLFYERYPNGRIVTELHSRSEREITFRALVYRGEADSEPAATGWA